MIALCLLTTACGSNTEQRTASGGLFGLMIGALAGGPLGAGIGFGAGIASGAATPIGADQGLKQALGWKEKTYADVTGQPAASGTSQPPSPVPAGAPLHVSPDTVKHIQSNLRGQSLYSGPIDGIVGPKTRTALRQYQQQQGLTPTGDIDTTTLQRLNVSASLSGSSNSASSGQMMTTDQVSNQLQSHGYSSVSDIKPTGNNDYTALAMQGDTTYVVAIDGKSGRVLSRRPAPAGVQPSSGATQPGGAGTTPPTGQGGTSDQTPQNPTPPDQQQSQ
jgi:peptidoglycan hydrolase-like protein with peptidoglycan-binding domain